MWCNDTRSSRHLILGPLSDENEESVSIHKMYLWNMTILQSRGFQSKHDLMQKDSLIVVREDWHARDSISSDFAWKVFLFQ